MYARLTLKFGPQIAWMKHGGCCCLSDCLSVAVLEDIQGHQVPPRGVVVSMHACLPN